MPKSCFACSKTITSKNYKQHFFIHVRMLNRYLRDHDEPAVDLKAKNNNYLSTGFLVGKYKEYQAQGFN